MLQHLNTVSWMGLLAAAPAILLTIRFILKLLISLIFSKEKVTITYRGVDGDKLIKKIYLKKNDDLLRVLDEIAKKNSHEGKSHG